MHPGVGPGSRVQGLVKVNAAKGGSLVHDLDSRVQDLWSKVHGLVKVSASRAGSRVQGLVKGLCIQYWVQGRGHGPGTGSGYTVHGLVKVSAAGVGPGSCPGSVVQGLAQGLVKARAPGGPKLGMVDDNQLS